MQLTLFSTENTPLPRKIMNPRLGLPYKGAKRKIASKLMQAMADYAPQANYFYDLFGGGGSMSLCAYANGYNVIYNELSKQTFLYFDLVVSQSQKAKGKYGILPDEYYKFVSKEKFDLIKKKVNAGGGACCPTMTPLCFIYIPLAMIVIHIYAIKTKKFLRVWGIV